MQFFDKAITYTAKYGKGIALLLCIVMIALVLPLPAVYNTSGGSDSYPFVETAVAGSNEDLMAAVYAYGEYDITLRNAVYCDGGRDDGVMLTDREYTFAKPTDGSDPTGWVMIKSYDGETDFRATVTVDIGYLAKDVNRFYLRAYRSSTVGSEMPTRIRYYVSEDGDDFELVGEGSTLTDVTADNCAAVYGLKLKTARTARFVRAVIDCDGAYSLWINEFGAAAYGNMFRANGDGSRLLRDGQGLVYRINGESAEVVGYETEKLCGTGELAPSTVSFDTNEIRYTLGNGSDNEVQVISSFIGDGRPNFSGVPNKIEYIVIHNTGTTEEVTDAARYNLRMHTTDGETGWHYTVDDSRIYHSLADSVVGFHAGSSHNYCSIGIEICVNGAPTKSANNFIFTGDKYDEWVDTRFRKSLKNAAVLVAELLTRYGLSTDAVIQHYDVTEKNCPLWLREKDGKFVYDGTLWLEFMGYVEEYYELLNGESPIPAINPNGRVVIPDYVTLSDGEVYPVTSIAPDAFVDKGELLTQITIGKSIESIPLSCFDGSDFIERIEVVEGNTCYRVENNLLLSIDGELIFDPEAAVSNEISPKDDCVLDIRELDGRNYIFCLDENYTLSEIAEEYGADSYSAVSMYGERITASDIPGTGTVLNFDGARLYLVLIGDADGNALVDQYDYILVKRSYLGTFSPLTRQTLAMKVSGSDEISVYDYLLIRRHFLGTYDLFKK